MNLIEQAAKRLEELKQAGAELPEGQRSDHLRAPIHATPTPEGVMRAFEAHRPSAIPIPGLRTIGSDEPARSHVGPTDDRSRRVELDLAALRKRGFVTPDSLKSQIADEFRESTGHRELPSRQSCA